MYRSPRRTRARSASLSGDGPPGDLLRPALELAWTVARLGERERPPVPAPRRLRPVLGRSHLSGAALATIRRVVDEDEAFRGRVAALAAEGDLGRTSWLWLTRPAGWAEEVAKVESGSAEQAAHAVRAAPEIVATRRIAVLEAELNAARLRVATLEDRLAEASAAARRFAMTIGELTAVLAEPETPERSVVPPKTAREGRASIRAPLPLPPAVLEDSAEAAAHLVRAPDALMVVDGYNVSFCGWPESDIADQRERLVGALSELAARSTTPVHVVFDGPEHEELPPQRGAARRAVRVVFSPPGIDADEVIIDLVASVPVHRPVLVATSDRRLQGEVRRQGANVLTSPQLLGLLGRADRRRR